MSMISMLLASRLWEAGGWTMIHFMWIGTLIGALAAAGRQFLRPARANWRYLFLLLCLATLAAAPWVVMRKILSHEGKTAVAIPAREFPEGPSAGKIKTSSLIGKDPRSGAVNAPVAAAMKPAGRWLDRKSVV